MFPRLRRLLEAECEEVVSFVQPGDPPPDRIVLSGSDLYASEMEPGRADLNRHAVEYAIEHGVPLLGICYGFHRLAQLLGGRLVHLPNPVRGYIPTSVGTAYVQFQDAVAAPPPGARCEWAAEGLLTAFRVGPLLRGVAWHPEGSADGRAWLREWLYRG